MTEAKLKVHVFNVWTGPTGAVPMGIEAEDYEVSGNGVHFVMDAGMESAFEIAFVSHPCVVVQERPARG